jgi:hypothetical protein
MWEYGDWEPTYPGVLFPQARRHVLVAGAPILDFSDRLFQVVVIASLSASRRINSTTTRP